MLQPAAAASSERPMRQAFILCPFLTDNEDFCLIRSKTASVVHRAKMPPEFFFSKSFFGKHSEIWSLGKQSWPFQIFWWAGIEFPGVASFFPIIAICHFYTSFPFEFVSERIADHFYSRDIYINCQEYFKG